MNNRIKRVCRVTGTYGTFLHFYQNILFAADDWAYECGLSTKVNIRHCHELRHKYPKKQCKYVDDEMYGEYYIDSLLVKDKPILLVEGHYQNSPNTVYIMDYKRLDVNHAVCLHNVNDYIYAIGYDDNDEHMICYIILPYGNELIMIDTLLGNHETIVDKFNHVIISDHPQRFIINKLLPSPDIKSTSRKSFCDIAITCLVSDDDI